MKPKKPKTEKKPSPLLDLHGFRVDDVFDAIDGFVSKHSSKNKIYIMTGRGSGKVLNETKRYLKLGGYPFSTYREPTGQANPGILVIHMED